MRVPDLVRRRPKLEDTPAEGNAGADISRSGRRRLPKSSSRRRLRGWFAGSRTSASSLLADVRKAARRTFLGAITPFGWAVAVGVVVSAAIGWGWGWLEFRTLALLGVLCLAIAVLFVLRRADYGVDLHLHKQRVRIGDQGMGRVLIRGRKGRSLGSHSVELPVGHAVARFRVPSLGGDDEHEELFAVPAKRRGVIPIGPVTAVQSDPLGLLRRERQLAEQVELFIHPEIIAVETGAVGFMKDVEGVTTQNLSSSDVAFHALREYVPGDDRRAVHWRTTARLGRLMVRQFEETMRAHLLIVLSLNQSDYRSPEDFELAVSVAGSIGVAAFREERQVTVHTTSGPMAFPSRAGMLDELSRLELREGTSLRAATAAAVKASPDVSVAAVVTGGRSTPTDIRAAELTLPANVECFAIRGAVGQVLGRKSIGRLTLVDIARLHDLGFALRSLR